MCTRYASEMTKEDWVKLLTDRLVLTLRPDQFSSWLDGSVGEDELVPAPDDMIRYWPVSKRINNVRVLEG